MKSNIDLDMDNETLANVLFHSHEKLTDLKSKFGYDYDVIAIKRDRHQRFISVWKHIIDMVDMGYPPQISEQLKSLTLDDILFYSSYDLLSPDGEQRILKIFEKTLDIGVYFDEYLKNMLLILIRPISYWHNHYPNIKWFDFDKLYELEKWVSNKLGKPFKLQASNGSQHFETKLILSNEFVNKYDSIYNYYDLDIKIAKTII
jgi:hypothetical protein